MSETPKLPDKRCATISFMPARCLIHRPGMRINPSVFLFPERLTAVYPFLYIYFVAGLDHPIIKEHSQ